MKKKTLENTIWELTNAILVTSKKNQKFEKDWDHEKFQILKKNVTPLQNCDNASEQQQKKLERTIYKLTILEITEALLVTSEKINSQDPKFNQQLSSWKVDKNVISSQIYEKASKQQQQKKAIWDFTNALLFHFW